MEEDEGGIEATLEKKGDQCRVPYLMVIGVDLCVAYPNIMGFLLPEKKSKQHMD